MTQPYGSVEAKVPADAPNGAASSAPDGRRLSRWLPPHWPAWLRGLAASVFLAVGFYIYLRVVSAKYPVEDWLFWDLGKLWLSMFAFNGCSVAFGYWLLKRVLRIRALPLAETVLFSMMLGVVAFCWAMYIGGALGWFRWWFAIALPLVFFAVGWRSFPELWRRYQYALRRQRTIAQPLERLLAAGAVLFGVLGIGLLYLGVATPSGINYDAAWYHLPVAQDYAREGGLVPFLTDHNRTFPQLTSLLHTWGFLLPGLEPQLRWTHVLHLEFTLVLWKIFAIVPFGQWLLGGRRTPALWAVFFLFPDIFVYDKIIGGSADHVLGFFAIPALLATLRTLPRLSTRYCFLLAIALGGAMLAKLQGVYLVVAAAGLLGGRALQIVWQHVSAKLGNRDVAATVSLKQVGLAALIICGGALLVWSPQPLRNAVFYHNPMFPYLQDVFPSPTTHEKSQFFVDNAFANRPYLPKGDTRIEKMWNAVKLFFTFSFQPHYSFTGYYPSMGSLFTLLLPGLLFVKRSRRLWLGTAAAFLMIFTWGNTYIGDRYLQGVLTVPIGVTAALIVRLWQLPWARLGLVPLIGLQLVWGGDAPFITGYRLYETSIDLFRSGYENKRTTDKRFPQRSWERRVTESTPKDAVILSRTFRTTLGIDRTVVSDVQAWQGAFFYEPIGGPRQLYELYKKHGVTHLMYQQGVFPHETLQGAVLFEELVRNYAGEQKSFGRVRLVKLPDQPPPPDPEEYIVFVAGLRDYPDGWYPVKELSLYERVPRELWETPKPKALVADKVDFNALMSQTQAMVLATKRRHSPAVKSALSRFKEVERFDHYSVHLLKAPPSKRN